MQRGAFFLVVQIAVCLLVTGLGVWALTRPRLFQNFVHTNYALLPAVKPEWQLTPVVLRCFGALLLWYAFTLAAASTTKSPGLGGRSGDTLALGTADGLI